jgi:antitoxin component YwqK of YwqJK toxin-antitoxin module
METNKEIRKENLINQFDENGNKHGYWEVYFSNGDLYYKGNYVNGIKHGYCESYYDNGILHYTGFYDMGNKVDYNPIELTLDEIAIKFNIPVEYLKIKK